jgi:hypothetical protein
VVMQVATDFWGLSEAWRGSLWGLDMGGLVGEVRLPDDSFKGCGCLRSVVWPAGLSSVGASCFQDCGLEVVDFGQTRLRSVGRWAFSGCGRLLRIIGPGEFGAPGAGSGSGICLSAKGGGEREGVRDAPGKRVTGAGCVTSPGGATSINATSPRALIELGGGAFYRCRRLSSVNLHATGIAVVGNEAFGECSGLESVTFPATLRALGESSFCGAAVSIVDLRGTRCMSIAEGGFFGCAALREVLLCGTVRRLGWRCFAESGVRALDLSRTAVRVIEGGVFRGCRDLRELRVPSTLESVGEYFVRDTALRVLDLSTTQVRCFSLDCVGQTKELDQLMLPRVLELLHVNIYSVNIWELCVYVDSLKRVTGSLGWLSGVRRLSLRGAAWWTKGGTCRECLAFSGCVGYATAGGPAVFHHLTRPLAPAA